MPNIDFSKLLTLKYWLEGTTAGDTVNTLPTQFGSFFFYAYIVIFCGFLVTAIVLTTAKLFLHKDHPLQSKFTFLAQNTAWMGILGLAWFACRQTTIAFLGARLWLIFGIIWVLVIKIWFLRYIFTFYPLEIKYFNKTQSSPVKKDEEK
jgi:hypothetical protein